MGYEASKLTCQLKVGLDIPLNEEVTNLPCVGGTALALKWHTLTGCPRGCLGCPSCQPPATATRWCHRQSWRWLEYSCCCVPPEGSKARILLTLIVFSRCTLLRDYKITRMITQVCLYDCHLLILLIVSARPHAGGYSHHCSASLPLKLLLHTTMSAHANESPECSKPYA